jgi:hypothetical protein
MTSQFMMKFPGEPDEIRTHDSRLKRAVLYRLSYWLAFCCALSQTINFTIKTGLRSSKKANGFIFNPQIDADYEIIFIMILIRLDKSAEICETCG